MHRSLLCLCLFSLLPFALTACAGDAASDLTRNDERPGSAEPLSSDSLRVLFIRGGDATGGLANNSTEHLSDIGNDETGRNHGWGQLARLLQETGYVIEQVEEHPVTQGTPTPVDLAGMDLSAYDVLVFGSNNAAYGPAAVDSVDQYVRRGGGLLFISDANWGQDWADAPTSDQPFLTPYGLEMHQDLGTYAPSRAGGDFTAAGEAHPILDGVARFTGEGVSPLRIVEEVPGVTATVLVRAQGRVRRNDNPEGRGTTTSATENDGALVVAEVGEGRLAGHFDRNTFFNAPGGVGAHLGEADNQQYAQNLFNWLAQRGGE